MINYPSSLIRNQGQVRESPFPTTCIYHDIEWNKKDHPPRNDRPNKKTLIFHWYFLQCLSLYLLIYYYSKLWVPTEQPRPPSPMPAWCSNHVLPECAFPASAPWLPHIPPPVDSLVSTIRHQFWLYDQLLSMLRLFAFICFYLSDLHSVNLGRRQFPAILYLTLWMLILFRTETIPLIFILTFYLLVNPLFTQLEPPGKDFTALPLCLMVIKTPSFLFSLERREFKQRTIT